jgi:hypothetical protein
MPVHRTKALPPAAGFIGKSLDRLFAQAVEKRGKHGQGEVLKGKTAVDVRVTDAAGHPVARRFENFQGPREQVLSLYDTKGDVTILGCFGHDDKVDYVEVHPHGAQDPSVVVDDSNRDGKADWVATEVSPKSYEVREDPKFNGTWLKDALVKAK